VEISIEIGKKLKPTIKRFNYADVSTIRSYVACSFSDFDGYFQKLIEFQRTYYMYFFSQRITGLLEMEF